MKNNNRGKKPYIKKNNIRTIYKEELYCKWFIILTNLLASLANQLSNKLAWPIRLTFPASILK